MSDIRLIDIKVSNLLQSQIKLLFISDIIRELIHNGIDAASKLIRITIKINHVEKSLEINYTDDGKGMDSLSLSDFGRRNFTSKLAAEVASEMNSEIDDFGSDNDAGRNELETLKNIKTFGFRGEAVNSLLNICSSVIVSSRPKEADKACKVCFDGDKVIGKVMKCEKPMPIGTNIRAIGVFDRVAVRKKIFFENIDKHWNVHLFDIKKVVFSCLAKHPQTHVEIFKEEFRSHRWNITNLVNTRSIQKQKSPLESQITLFKTIFGSKSSCHDFEMFKVKYKGLQLQTFIGLSPVQTKNYQFIYLNGWPFKNDEFFRKINSKFQSNYEIWGSGSKMGSDSDKKNGTIYGKPYGTHPIIIAFFDTPIEISDLIQDPNKVCYNSRYNKALELLFFKVIEFYFQTFKKTNVINNINKEGLDEKNVVTVNEAQRRRENRVVMRKRQREEDVAENNGVQGIASNLTDSEIVLTEDSEKADKTISNCEQCYNVMSQREIKQHSSYFKIVEKLELKRQDLQNFKIIGQVDRKFILVKYLNNIMVLDQHAADERVLLEKIYKELVQHCFKDRIEVTNRVKPTIRVNLHEDEILLIVKHIESVNFWGIMFNDDYTQITHLPPLISDRFGKVADQVIQSGILDYIYNLEDQTKMGFAFEREREKLKYRQSYNGSFHWVRYAFHMPTFYRETIKLKACRMAIKFGQLLPRDEQQKLVNSLSACYHPFICAHDRPSVYPICGL